MEKRLRSLLDDLTEFDSPVDRTHFVESKAVQLIASYIHLQKLIEESFDQETADDLTKRLLLSMRAGDSRRITRKLNEMRSRR